MKADDTRVLTVSSRHAERSSYRLRSVLRVSREYVFERLFLCWWCDNFNTQVKPTLKHGQVTESCYQMDMGKDGEIPRNRRIWYKTGMSSTTLDLFDGTTKSTYQVGSRNTSRCCGGDGHYCEGLLFCTLFRPLGSISEL